MLLVGVAVGWFAIWGDYWLLMNPVFKWLTISGAVLVLVFSLAVIFNQSSSPHYSNIFIFIFLILIVFVGRPYSSATNPIAKMINPFVSGKFKSPESGVPKTRLNELYFSTKKETGTKYIDQSFTVVGQIKRLPELDRQGYFALMEYVMFCCAADAVALGFLVPDDKAPGLKDGDWVEATGKLKKFETPFTIPKFRFGSANFTTVNEDYIIEIEKIAGLEDPFQDLFQNISDILTNSPNNGIFLEALMMSGYMGKIEAGDNYTVFALFDELFTTSPTMIELLYPENKDRLKRLISLHIVKGKLLKKDLFDLTSVTTISNEELPIRVENGKVYVGEARILFADRTAQNGVVHYVYPSVMSINE